MSQRTVVVIGATAGIGLEAARTPNAAGHRLILAGRTPGRVAALQSNLTDAVVLQADISTRAGIDRLAAVERQHPERRRTEPGYPAPHEHGGEASHAG